MASFGNTLQGGYMLLLILAFSTWVSGIDVNVCASFNTAQTPLNVSIWQTNGLCGTYCRDRNYAFSITQQNSCWCSNFYPDKTTQVEVSKCNVACPAWTPEDCGGPGLFGYILLNEVAPSGTKTPPASSSTQSQSTASTATTASSSTTTSSSASSSSSSSTSETSTTSSSSSSSSSTGSSSSSSSSSTSSSQTTPSRAPPGQTTDPSQTDGPSGDRNGGSVKHKSGLATGAIVGIVVGVVGGLLVGAILFWLFLFRRRRQNRDEYKDDPSVRGSSSGMVGSVPPEMSGSNGSPASPVSAANRNSTIMIDPRMDPFKQGLYIRGSHESLNTIRDDHDYSRRIQPPKVLRATNPDPED